MKVEIRFGDNNVKLKGRTLDDIALDLDSKLNTELVVEKELEIRVNGKRYAHTVPEPTNIVDALNIAFQTVEF